MKVSKDAARTARRLFRLSLVDGRLDENRAMMAVRKVASAKPRGYASILHAFKRLVRLELDRRKVTVQSAKPLADREQQQIRSSLESQYEPGLIFDFSVNPELIGGLKIRVGDDVFDGSVRGRLNRLEQQF